MNWILALSEMLLRDNVVYLAMTKSTLCPIQEVSSYDLLADSSCKLQAQRATVVTERVGHVTVHEDMTRTLARVAQSSQLQLNHILL